MLLFFGTDYSGTSSLSLEIVFDTYSLKQDLYIQNNIIASIDQGAMMFNNCLGKIFIQGNYLNVNKNMEKIGRVYTALFNLGNCSGEVLIGGENIGEGNVFTNSYWFTEIRDSPKVILSIIDTNDNIKIIFF